MSYRTKKVTNNGCSTSRPGCSSSDHTELNSHADILRHYKKCYQQVHREELSWFASATSLNKAIERACRSEYEDGKLHSHQYRQGRARLKKWSDVVLLSERTIQKQQTFEDLLSLLRRLSRDQKMIGTLCTYDTAQRIGAYMKLEPTEIELHAGTRQGAINLGLNVKDGYVSASQLPPPLDQLSASEAEDVLCIYKDAFLKIRNDAN